MDVQLNTQRLLLRPIQNNDLADLFELDADPEVHRYLGNKPVRTTAEVAAIIADIQAQYVTNGIGRLAIIDKASGEFVGWSGLKYETKVRPQRPYYDLGYRLKRKYWGRGIATEAGLASLHYGFTTLQLAEICAAAQVAHLVSNHILGNKLGMIFVETFTYADTLCNWYRLGKADWLA